MKKQAYIAPAAEQFEIETATPLAVSPVSPGFSGGSGGSDGADAPFREDFGVEDVTGLW